VVDSGSPVCRAPVAPACQLLGLSVIVERAAFRDRNGYTGIDPQYLERSLEALR